MENNMKEQKVAQAIRMPKQRESAFVALVTPGKCIVYVRPESRRKLHAVGGKCEAEEDARAAVIREVWEELHLKLDALKLQLAGEAHTQYKNDPDVWYEQYYVYYLSPEEFLEIYNSYVNYMVEDDLDVYLVDDVETPNPVCTEFDVIAMLSGTAWMLKPQDFSGPGTWFLQYFHHYPHLLEE